MTQQRLRALMLREGVVLACLGSLLGVLLATLACQRHALGSDHIVERCYGHFRPRSFHSGSNPDRGPGGIHPGSFPDAFLGYPSRQSAESSCLAYGHGFTEFCLEFDAHPSTASPSRRVGGDDPCRSSLLSLPAWEVPRVRRRLFWIRNAGFGGRVADAVGVVDAPGAGTGWAREIFFYGPCEMPHVGVDAVWLPSLSWPLVPSWSWLQELTSWMLLEMPGFDLLAPVVLLFGRRARCPSCKIPTRPRGSKTMACMLMTYLK